MKKLVSYREAKKAANTIERFLKQRCFGDYYSSTDHDYPRLIREVGDTIIDQYLWYRRIKGIKIRQEK